VSATTLAKRDIRFVWLLAIVSTLVAILVFLPLGVALALGFAAYAVHRRLTTSGSAQMQT